MKYPLVLSVVLITFCFVHAEPPKVVPVPRPVPTKIENIEGAVVNKIFELAAEPASRWRNESSEFAELRVYNNGKTGVFVANKSGSYIIVVTGPSGDTTEIRIVVADDNKPVPPTPTPKDELKEKLVSLFNTDTAPLLERKENAKDLAELYRQAAILANSVEVKTSKALLEKCQKSATALIGSDKLILVRKAVSAELATILPTDAPLSDEQRKSTVELFTKLSVIFKQLGE